MRRRLLLAAPLLLGGCSFLRNLFGRRKPAPAPAPEVHYVLGRPYETGAVWRYPRERFDYDETGLAIAIGAHGPFATDGALYDPTALIAAHPTLQLPCVARVTNLETGLQVAVRIDDRGPEQPSRLIALSPRAMTLLGAGSTAGVLRVRVQVLEAESRALAESLPGSQPPPLAVSAAPSGTVEAEPLAPPPGATGRAGVPLAAAGPPAARNAAIVPARLPEVVTQVPPRPGQLFVDAGAFSRPEYARLLVRRMAGLGAQVDTSYAAPRDRAYRVRIGPLETVGEADATLDRALRAGVVDARIVIDTG